MKVKTTVNMAGLLGMVGVDGTREWDGRGSGKCENDNGRHRFQFPFALIKALLNTSEENMFLPHLFVCEIKLIFRIAGSEK